MQNIFKLTFLFVVISTISQAQNIVFTDANFKQGLLNHNPVIDTNNDGEISFQEALNTTIVDIGNSVNSNSNLFLYVSNIDELQYFPNLTYLNCDSNFNIQSIPLQHLPKLEHLYAGNNNLKEHFRHH